MKAQTLQAVKSMTKNPNLINAAKALFQAMAYEQTVREVIEAKQQEVVDFYKFKVPQENLRYIETPIIKRRQDMYMASDEDFKIYASEMDSFHREKGFKKPSPDHCPLLMAESMRRETIHAFIDLLEPYTGINRNMLFARYKLYDQYVDLNLSLFAPLVKID
jgi:hypothetical protein